MTLSDPADDVDRVLRFSGLEPAGPPSAQAVAQSGLTAVEYRDSVSSTMDVAHDLAASGASAGTAVLASTQIAGRGRSGHSWVSMPDSGLWLTVIERPADRESLAVLSLRVGIHLAMALSPLVDGPIGLKWPNDLYGPDGKLSGILVEARWRDGRPEWVAIGVGVNRFPPPGIAASAVRPEVSRDTLLVVVAQSIRTAASKAGALTEDECGFWAERDIARGRRVSSPLKGIVAGVTADGGSVILTPDGNSQVAFSGSLTFVDPFP